MNRNVMLAKQLVRLAKEIVAFKDDETQEEKQAEAQKIVDDFERNFVSQLPEDIKAAMAAVAEADRIKKEAEKVLKDKQKEWAAATGFDKAKKAFEISLQKFQEFGVNVGELTSQYGKLTSGQSSRSSDAELANVLLSLMNETMRNKYATIREDFKKLTVKYTTGNKLLDVEFSDFNENAKELMSKNKINVKKSSLQVKAGLWDAVKNFSKMVKDFFAGAIAKLATVIESATDVSEDIDVANDKIEKALSKVK